MAKPIRCFFLLILVLLFLNGCNSNNVNEDIFEFKGSYIGDNSAVGSIVNRLPNGEHITGFELKTKEEPHGIILNYEGIETNEIERMAIYNATFIFALVQNAEWVRFNFEHHEYQLTKEDLQVWHGQELSEYSSEDQLRKLTEESLKDENKVNALLK